MTDISVFWQRSGQTKGIKEALMKVNMGNADRGIRLILGLSILTWGFMAENVWGALGLIFLLTAFLKRCPAYLPFKIDTRHKDLRELS